MAAVTENDLKELKDLINSRFDELKEGQKVLEIGQAEIKGEIKILDARLSVTNERIQLLETSFQKIPDLAEKVGELKNWKQAGLIVITAMVSSIFSGTIGGVIGWLIKGSRV